MIARGARRLLYWAASSLLALGCTPALPGVCSPPPPPAEPATDTPFAIVGDTQRTFWLEAFGREQNETERRALMARLESEHPAELVHVGDMVVYGSLDSEWRYFDGLVSPFRCARVPIHPVLGNHDYWGDHEGAIARARARFPELGRTTFYSRQRGRLGLVMLDSNLRGRSATVQRDWLRLTLHRFAGNDAIRAVIAFTHHPPFTLGQNRAGDPYVRDTLLPELERSDKFLLMVSGHVHGYERFAVRGHAFVVTGGGGGPRVDYRAPNASDPEAALTGSAKRPFNYVFVHPGADSLELVARCLPGSDCPTDGVLDRKTLAYPPRNQPR